MNNQVATYNRARSHLMSSLLFRYSRTDLDKFDNKKPVFKMSISEEIPIGALVIPFAIVDAKQWYLGWYRGKDEKGNDLIEGVEDHTICKFYNCGFLYNDDLEFCNQKQFFYTDRQFEIYDTIRNRVSRNNYWFVVGWLDFYEDGSFDVPIRKKFTDDFYTKTYKNLRSATIAELDKHCHECNEINKQYSKTTKQ